MQRFHSTRIRIQCKRRQRSEDKREKEKERISSGITPSCDQYVYGHSSDYGPVLEIIVHRPWILDKDDLIYREYMVSRLLHNLARRVASSHILQAADEPSILFMHQA